MIDVATTLWGSRVQLDRPRHPCVVVLPDPVGVAVCADGANGTTRVSPEEAARRGIYVPSGVDSVPLACYQPADRGARSAWHPKGRLPYGLDAPESAGPSGDPWGYVTQGGSPVIQGAGDPAPGYYVSCTALYDGRWPKTSPLRYFDAAGVPGWVLPRRELDGVHVALGDLALLRRGHIEVWAQCFDVGPYNPQRIELSPRACELLDINADARRGGCSAADGVLITILPGSRATYWAGGIVRPLSADLLQDAGERAAKAAGLGLGD